MVEPFGNDYATGTPNVGVQKMFGATLVDFSVQADWSSQGGKFSATLVEDDTDSDKFIPPVINAPYFFELRDLSNNLIFEYAGIVNTLNRHVSPESKVYSVELVSPNKILKNANIILDGYAGYGGSIEGLPLGISKDGYYEAPPNAIDGYSPNGVLLSNTNSAMYFDELSFGTNNNSTSIDWNTNYNILNVFGAYENDKYYQFPDFHGFGAAGTNNAGMRLDRLIPALHQLINHTTSSAGTRYLGGTLLYGTDDYDLTASVNPYYYGFDAIGFYNQVSGAVSKDFRVPVNDGVISILDMIQSVCEEANFEFIITLKPQTIMSDGGGSDNSPIDQTYPGTIYGGWIQVQTFSKNNIINATRPYSTLSSAFLNLEIPDYGDYGVGNVNPGVEPVGYRDPLEADYTFTGTEGSAPYGGKFPVATNGDMSSVVGSVTSKIKDGSISLQATDGTAYKFVVGGRQTRVAYIPGDYIYQSWGDLEFVDTPTASTGIMETATRKVPVVTPVLPANDMNDFILIDCQDIFGSDDVCSTVRKGIYVASQLEIRMAMTSYESWIRFVSNFKPKKVACIDGWATYKKNNSAFNTAHPDFTSASGDPVIKSNPQHPQMNFDVYFTRNQVIDARQTPKLLRFSRHFINSLLNQSATPDKTRVTKLTSVKNGTGNPTSDKAAASEFYKETMSSLHKRVKEIGDKHYGKSWCAVMPYPTTKLTDNNEEVVGNFAKSWDIADSAYLEPSSFNAFKAPKSNLFVSDGTIRAYVNYDYSFSGTAPISGVFSSYSLPANTISTFDFSEYSPNNMAYANNIASVVPQSVADSYAFLPYNYFDNYDRTKIPSLRFVDGDLWQLSILAATGVAGQLNPTISKMPNGKFSPFGSSTNQSVEDLGVRMSVMADIIDDFIGASGVNDHGLNSIHIVNFTTNRVFMPKGLDHNPDYKVEVATMDVHLKRQGESLGVVPSGTSSTVKQLSMFDTTRGLNAFPFCMTPLGIGIPQISNRHRYGPWVTTFNKKFAGNAEYVMDDSLVPENFLVPLYGAIPTGVTFSLNETLSGFAGLNLAGQATANSIDNFLLFADEQGTLTLPGTPRITSIGQALVLDSLTIAPYITDISVKMSNDTIETTYNFRTYSPRQNRTNRDIIKGIQKMSNSIKKIYKGR